MSISVNAVSAHIFNPGHGGDHLGICGQDPCAPSSIVTKSATASPVAEDDFTNSLQVSAIPNPSSGYFNLLLQSKESIPITVRIRDIYGRIIFKQASILPNTTLRVGEKFVDGTYYVEVIQGRKISSVKLVKAR